jgi:hypothetical protein
VTRHLLVALTGHGYGHAAQTAPVVAALRALRPELRITLRCNLAPTLLAIFFPDVDSVTTPTADFGVPMRSAIDVDAAAAERAFTSLHQRFASAVAAESEALVRLRSDLVLANVGYVPIAAAARAGIPAIGFSSLNWLGVVRAYAAAWHDADAILADMAASYRAARRFIRPTPAMAMPDLDTVQVGPVARRGVRRRAELAKRLGLAAGERVVLISLDGIDTSLDLAVWPAVPGLRYVVAGLAPPPRSDMAALHALGISHIDCLASCDAVLTKPGYGTLVEAACHAIPTLFVRRGVWPEEPALVDWLVAYGTAREISRAALECGALAPELSALWTMTPRQAVSPTGNDAAARLIAEYL